MIRIEPNDERIVWAGAAEVEHGRAGSRGWRLPLSRLPLFPGEGLRSRAAMQAGIRLVFRTDATVIGVAVAALDDLLTDRIDLFVDGSTAGSAVLDADGHVAFRGLPPAMKSVEVWLPQYGELRITGLFLSPGARMVAAPATERRELIAYGSSITQCRSAASPSTTWPAMVAKSLDMELTCLGFGSECHLDPMIARWIRDHPADLVITCLGINVYGSGTFSQRSFLPTALGFLSTIRDGHPDAPLVVISPIVSPDRENLVGPTGMTLARLRSEVEMAAMLLADTDNAIHLISGPEIFGPEQADLLHDGLHPSAAGYAHLAAALLTKLETGGIAAR